VVTHDEKVAGWAQLHFELIDGKLNERKIDERK
jgi:ABC-type lipoprotein export system ATPase subunit